MIFFHPRVFFAALRYSVPVLLGYMAIGIAFGLMLVDAGYPWWLSLVMSLVMYAGAGQYIGVGLFAAGAGLGEAVLVQLVVNARHMAYGLSMLKRINAAGIFKYYLIFGLTDETFALLSSQPEDWFSPEDRGRFMFYVTALDQAYWVIGSAAGAAAGTLIPFNIEGIGFSLTALFVVLMIEQILRVKKESPGSKRWVLPFLISALGAAAAVLALPPRLSLLSAMAGSLALVQILDQVLPDRKGGVPC
jgi:4-azaleucine resistance transporter AzlC